MESTPTVQIPLEWLLKVAVASGPSTFDIVALVVTVVLGVLSLVLAYMVFRLSQGFELKADSALQRIETLSVDVRQMIASGLVGQTELSNKMLDSILSGAYGQPLGHSPTSVSEQDMTMAAITKLLDERLPVDTLPTAEEVRELKDDVRRLARTPSRQAVGVVSDRLYRKISNFSRYPGFVVLLASILDREARSLSDVHRHQREDHVPSGVDGGVERLLEDGILVGDEDSFTVNPEFEGELRAFIEVNQPIVDELKSYYEAHPDTLSDSLTPVSGTTRAIASSLVF